MSRDIPCQAGLVDCGPNPEEEYREAELRNRLLQFAGELSPTLRRAFQLRDLDGLTTSGVGQILGVVEGTVKARVARARSRLIRLVRRALDAQPHSSSPRTLLQVAEGKAWENLRPLCRSTRAERVRRVDLRATNA